MTPAIEFDLKIRNQYALKSGTAQKTVPSQLASILSAQP